MWENKTLTETTAIKSTIIKTEEKKIATVIAAIDYIEEHLAEKLDLDAVARGVHYSKYHVHRMFVREVGLTIHDYVQRRQLTEAARLLVFSKRPVLEIALLAGYESQQAFAAVFKQMYKKTPNQYREEEGFYPLQLRYRLNQCPVKDEREDFWEQRIVFAELEDIPQWLSLVELVIDGFPCLDKEDYQVRLREAIARRRALMVKDGDIAVGVMAFQKETGSIDFLGIHPQYRKQGIAEAFLRKVMGAMVFGDTQISTTTFREGDRADTGYRRLFKELGFAGKELLVEYGYPVQRFVLESRHSLAQQEMDAKGRG